MADKVLVFIDGPNLNRQQTEMEISINWEAFRNILVGDREVVGVRYYTNPPIHTNVKGFHTYLQGIGYEVFTCKQGEDVDDLILTDIHELYLSADVIILVGGDGVFADALKEAVESGKEIEVVCVSTMLNADFSAIAEIIDPSTFKDQITDLTKTRKRLQNAAERATEISPGAEFVGQIMALPGVRVSIEARQPREIIIRLILPPNYKG